jgi:hypothetical protein
MDVKEFIFRYFKGNKVVSLCLKETDYKLFKFADITHGKILADHKKKIILHNEQFSWLIGYDKVLFFSCGPSKDFFISLSGLWETLDYINIGMFKLKIIFDFVQLLLFNWDLLYFDYLYFFVKFSNC